MTTTILIRKVWKRSRLFASVDWQAVNRIDWDFPQALSKSWQMLVFLIINYNLYTTDSTSMACMVYLHWRQQKNPLVALSRIPQEWLQTREFSPKYFHISNSRNGKQSETPVIIFFSGMCKITKEVESIFRTNTFSFGSLSFAEDIDWSRGRTLVFANMSRWVSGVV